MTTLRDALEDAFKDVGEVEHSDVAVLEKSEPSESPSISETVTKEYEKADQLRDDSGKYVPAKDKSEEGQNPEVKADLPQRKPPSSWKKDYWGHWDKVVSNPELSPMADYIEQRESEYAKGVSTYRDEAMKAKALQDVIAPFIPDMQRHGIAPEVEIRNLLSAHHTLVSASPQDKLQMFARLAMEYGVPLQAITGQQYDPQSAQIMQEVSNMRSQLGKLHQTQQQREQLEIASSIEAFKAEHEHFDVLREAMAGLLQAGVAQDLKTAYDKALRLNDDIFKADQAKQAQAAEKARLAKLAEKKATAVSTKSSAPTAQRGKAVSGNDLRSLLGAAFDQHTSGRL
jgi:hypothetical protein